MKINPNIFKAYDIRGIYPTDINETVISKIIKAIYFYFSDKLNKEVLKVGIGCDMRISSPILYQKSVKSLLEIGASVYELGMVPTPTVYFAAINYHLDVGIQISASHNPPEWNGVKFFYCHQGKIYKASKEMGMEAIKNLVLTEEIETKKTKKGTLHQIKDSLKKEVDFAFELVQPKINKLKIVVDPANTMGIIMFNELWKRLPVQVIKLNYQLDGRMPSHEANPLKFETLKDLQEQVVKEKADLGIATDGDADRVFFIDETGQIIPSSLISSLIAREIFLDHPNALIMADVRYTNNIKNVVEKYRGKFIVSPVGHALITKKLNEHNAFFCGESSGHYYFKETGGAESTVRVIITILDLISRSKTSLSKLVKEVQSSYESGEINYQLPKQLTMAELFKKIKMSYRNKQIVEVDGLTIQDNDWRFNLRGSNTEPLIRLNLEAKNKQILNNKLLEIKELLINQGLIMD